MHAQATRDYANAMIDCTSAAFAISAATASLSFECWRQSLAIVPPGPPANRSWYRKPAFASPGSSPMPLSIWGALDPPAWTATAIHPWAALYPSPSPASLANAWLGLFPLRGPPAAWPFAFAMMASGVPRSVALPTAEANAAMIDAADAATKPIRQVFASYHGGGGHAVSILAVPPSLLFAALAMQMASPPWGTI